MIRKQKRRQTLVALGFLLPNILGFLAFILIPLFLSFSLAFTDWDILRHNIFKAEPLVFIGLENFIQLTRDPAFWQALGNTFFLMMGLPFAVMGSLGAALLLTRSTVRPRSSGTAMGLATAIMVISAIVLMAGGFSQNALLALFTLLAAGIFLAGILSGGILYRTLFYIPHFTAGVATFILWKKLYNPHTGPINKGLDPLLDGVGILAVKLPILFNLILPSIGAAFLLLLIGWQLRRLIHNWAEANSGPGAIAAGTVWPAFAIVLVLQWGHAPHWLVWSGGGLAWAGFLAFALTRPRPWGSTSFFHGGGTELALWMVAVPTVALAALSLCHGGTLVTTARAGPLFPPNWLGDYSWAKPALMIMALWAAIGSNNMILYLAGLGNISPELYEAADMDGASSTQRFRFITWPQLAPVTFFIVVMGVIYGLQGGFEMARTMTEGGPAGATTTLSYFIFIQGFETGNLGYASAAAWVLFLLVFFFSMLNFRFGNIRDNY